MLTFCYVDLKLTGNDMSLSIVDRRSTDDTAAFAGTLATPMSERGRKSSNLAISSRLVRVDRKGVKFFHDLILFALLTLCCTRCRSELDEQ